MRNIRVTPGTMVVALLLLGICIGMLSLATSYYSDHELQLGERGYFEWGDLEHPISTYLVGWMDDPRRPRPYISQKAEVFVPINKGEAWDVYDSFGDLLFRVSGGKGNLKISSFPGGTLKKVELVSLIIHPNTVFEWKDPFDGQMYPLTFLKASQGDVSLKSDLPVKVERANKSGTNFVAYRTDRANSAYMFDIWLETDPIDKEAILLQIEPTFITGGSLKVV